jgi:hypothetical protein
VFEGVSDMWRWESYSRSHNKFSLLNMLLRIVPMSDASIKVIYKELLVERNTCPKCKLCRGRRRTRNHQITLAAEVLLLDRRHVISICTAHLNFFPLCFYETRANILTCAISRWVFETNPWAKHTPTLVRLEMLEGTSPGHY